MKFAVAGYWTRAKWDVADLKTLLQCDVGLAANDSAENDHTEPRRRKPPVWTLSAERNSRESPSKPAKSLTASTNFGL